ncbi:hypothetical protein [Pseudomonas izuensis]|uniref:Uncharacterized protein n=1 Tax=Pseudomonas izuensis TaxID=2684212 RepID=A0ABM7RPT2_9PSED|nr:hypothetical protein [Pseudomonas izuensis]BCX67704.1 hypothetical protein LAB08_R23400 [Pseudomonas izuensis]
MPWPLFQGAGSCFLVNILFAFWRFISKWCSRKIPFIQTLPRTSEMTCLKNILALLTTLVAISTSLAIHAEESGAFVERNKAQGEHTAKVN